MSFQPGRTRHLVRPPIAAINALAARETAAGRDLINLGQALLGLPPPVEAGEEVLRYLAKTAVHGYSPDPGVPEVIAVVADFLSATKGTRVAPDEVMLTCGANQAYVNALLTATDPGDEVVLFAPYYFDHLFAIQLAHCVPVFAPMHLADRRFHLDLEVLAERLTERTRVVTLVSPANPAGAVFPPAKVAELAGFCRAHGLTLIADETYDLLTFPPARFLSPRALVDRGEVVVVGSFSKTFGLAAWRVGYLWADAAFQAEAVKVQDALVVCAPVPSQWAVRGALRAAESFRRTAVEALVARRDALLQALDGVESLEPTVPDGATFIMARITNGMDSVSYATALLEGPGIVSVPGVAFGEAGEGFVRLSFGNQPVKRLVEAGERMRSWLLFTS